MVLTGTIVDALGILVGGAAGLAAHKLWKQGIPERFSDMVLKGVGLSVLYVAFSGMLDGSKVLVIVLSLVSGAIIGEWINLDSKMTSLGNALEKRFSHGQSGAFSQGFLSATLLFCVGTMAIKGSLDSGLIGDHSTLFAKAVMDTVLALVFASSMGAGVLFSAVPVFLYQGAIALLAAAAQPFLGDAVIAEMNSVGSLLLFALALDMLGVLRLRLANFIPAMFFPILFCLFL